LAVPAGSEAEYAGLEPDDVLVAIGERAVRTSEDARDLLAGPLGHDVVVEIERQSGSSSERIKLRVQREAVRR
jgi:C-terminal processing protease CtpA/Prc